MSSEIDAHTLRCNACWRDIKTGHCYKTPCAHLFCQPCATTHFGRALTCPLCNAELAGDAIVELTADRSPDVAIALYGYASFHGAEAERISADAAAFARGQTALYGTRETWVKSQEGAALKRRVIEAENKLNSMRVRSRRVCRARGRARRAN